MDYKKQHQVGDGVTGAVGKIHPKSAAITLEAGVRGHIYIGEISDYRIPSVSSHLTIGQSYDFRILEYDDDRQQVNLSRRGLPARRQERIAAPKPTPVRKPVPEPARKPRSAMAEGAGVEEATAAACDRAGLRQAQVTVEILDKGKRTFLGRVKRLARVRVTEIL